MKIVFNLKKAFKSIREAMAGKRLAYKEPMQWWRIDEIEAGDPTWLEWVQGNPEKGITPNKSLINALADARNDYYRKKLTFRARYGVSDAEVNTFYRMYVGYAPTTGMRAMHIGPYTAKAGPWKRTIELLKKSPNKSLSPENLLALADSIQLPQIPEGFDMEAPENKGSEIVKEFKAKMREKRGILEVRADIQNKFNYFVKTYNKIARKDMNKGVNIYLQKLLKSVGTMFGEEDLGIIVKSFPPEKVGQLDGRVMGWVDSKFDSIDPNTPEGQKLMNGNVLLGDGSFLTLNSRGMNKLLLQTSKDGKWDDLYEKAIQAMAVANNKPVEQMRTLVAEDSTFSNMFLEQLQNIQKELKAAGDFRADFLDVALNKKPQDPPKVGAQQTSTNRISKTQWSILEFNMDVLEAINNVGTDDPQKVADYLNTTRKVHKTIAKGKFTADLVGNWINAIKAEDQKFQKLKKKKAVRSYQEIYESAKKEYQMAEQNESLRDSGVPELETAFKFASLSYMKSPLEFIDPKTNTKLQLTDAPNMFAREDDPNLPITSKRMTELRMAREKISTEEEAKKALKAEIAKEIGNINMPTTGMEPDANLDITEKKESQQSEVVVEATPDDAAAEAQPQEATPQEFDFDVNEVPQEKIPQGTPPPTSPTTPTPGAGAEPVPEPEPEPEAQQKTPKKLDLKSLLGNTVESLIVMARDLDSQGKEDAAEEIHKIIRKYQGRI